MSINRDRVVSADAAGVSRSAMQVITSLQNHPTEEQMLGLTAAFLLLCKHHKQNPGDLFLIADNVMNGVTGRRPEFHAVQMYMENEL